MPFVVLQKYSRWPSWQVAIEGGKVTTRPRFTMLVADGPWHFFSIAMFISLEEA